jgi:cytochrome c-type biogenesis protein CcmH/NrfF
MARAYFGYVAHIRSLLVWLAFFAASFAAPAALASDAPTEGDRAQEIADQLESPFCPGRTISSCTSPAAAEWRVEIQTWVDEGVPSEEIRGRLSKRAGRDLRFVPQDDSFYGLLAVGAVLSLATIGIITMRVRRRDEEDVEQASGDADVDDERDAELERRLDAELAFED